MGFFGDALRKVRETGVDVAAIALASTASCIGSLFAPPLGLGALAVTGCVAATATLVTGKSKYLAAWALPICAGLDIVAGFATGLMGNYNTFGLTDFTMRAFDAPTRSRNIEKQNSDVKITENPARGKGQTKFRDLIAASKRDGKEWRGKE